MAGRMAKTDGVEAVAVVAVVVGLVEATAVSIEAMVDLIVVTVGLTEVMEDSTVEKVEMAGTVAAAAVMGLAELEVAVEAGITMEVTTVIEVVAVADGEGVAGIKCLP